MDKVLDGIDLELDRSPGEDKRNPKESKTEPTRAQLLTPEGQRSHLIAHRIAG